MDQKKEYSYFYSKYFDYYFLNLVNKIFSATKIKIFLLENLYLKKVMAKMMIFNCYMIISFDEIMIFDILYKLN
jgi:hypothetical protein